MELVATIHSPLSVVLPRKTKADKKFILNLNVYRNTHYMVLNQAKHLYELAISPQIDSIPQLDKITTVFIVYPKTKRLTDIPNVCIIHDKFIMDTLVNSHKLQDDNYLHHHESRYIFGKVDKENPRVDIQIYQ